MVQTVKKLPAIQETRQVQTVGQEDPLEKGMTTHSSILAWEIWTEEPGGCSPWGHKELDMTERLTFLLNSDTVFDKYSNNFSQAIFIF